MNCMPRDTRIFNLIEQEAYRQEMVLNLIASENYVSEQVRQAAGSILTNKYAEGYPGKRYYAGCSVIDEIEQLAIDRCLKLFGAEYANVQPHAGSQANMAVYTALLQPGDTILGMSLNAGGHLTHGHSVNFSGKFFKSISYGVNKDTELLDYDEITRLADEYKPKLIVCGASAYSRTIDFERFATIAQSVNAYLLADIAHIAGLVATGIHSSPMTHADVVTSTTHKTLRGPRGGLIMGKKLYASAIDRAIMPGMQGGPLLHTIAAKAVAFYEALEDSFASYQNMVVANARELAQNMQELGYRIVAGGTDNHLFVIDLRSSGITGLAAQFALEQAGIIVSRSCIPFDPERPWVTSGIRLGTPAVTTRGFTTHDMPQIAEYIHTVIQEHDVPHKLSQVRKKIEELCKKRVSMFMAFPKNSVISAY